MVREDAAEQARRIARMAGMPVPEASNAPAAAVEQAAPAAPAPAPAAPEKTAMEAASQAAAPDTEGDKIGDPPIKYVVAFGEEKRELTPDQIRATFERYAALNHKHAQLKPVLEVAEKIMSHVDNDPQKTADLLVHAVRKAFAPNPTMGNPAPKNEGADNPTTKPGVITVEDLAKWEEENAASLPPGYKEMFVAMQSYGPQMQQMLGMMQQLMQHMAGVSGSAQNLEAASREREVSAIKQTINNNLRAAGAKHKLAEGEEPQFMTFAAERGYTLEDFLDPALADKVMGDYVANRNTPELQRLTDIARRRQAFTGTLDPMPGAGATAAPTQEGDQMLARLAERAARDRRFS